MIYGVLGVGERYTNDHWVKVVGSSDSGESEEAEFMLRVLNNPPEVVEVI